MLFPNDEENSEALLNLLYKKNIKKAKIILLKGENGRTLVEKNLSKNNFNISVIECYKKSFKIISSLSIKQWRAYKINTLIITSGDVLKKLNEVIDVLNKNEWLFRCKIFVVGYRLAEIAKKIGWKDIIVCNYANNENLLKIIKKHN
ncbi:uroporphyrinogen-III synthase [Buchnera aphidicola]|uniref:uroporphyrinogen-III synthase n=1 Tax=Buchnera aphidicola TaxID=9 RepID=UPI0015BD0E71|nr:uroporphyrinogen-III synthase [Buchnera aphidicola]UPT14890.1 uroporphyrinogen-III synthase [Buchnera aphidicola (Aphis gossypii)]